MKTLRDLCFVIEVIALVMALLIVAKASSQYGVVARYGIDIAKVVPSKDFRCVHDMKDGQEVGPGKCAGKLTIIWRGGSGRIEVETR